MKQTEQSDRSADERWQRLKAERDQRAVAVVELLRMGHDPKKVSAAIEIVDGWRQYLRRDEGASMTDLSLSVNQSGTGTVLLSLIYRLMREIERQDEKHGLFEGTTLGRSRLALACLEDEIKEAQAAWRDERGAPAWDHTQEEVLQVAAVAMRALRDAL